MGHLRAIRARSKVMPDSVDALAAPRLAAVAATGVDRISVGALTHSAPALDLSLYLEPLL